MEDSMKNLVCKNTESWWSWLVGAIPFFDNNPLDSGELETIFDGFKECLLWAESVVTQEGDCSFGQLEDYYLTEDSEESIRRAFDARLECFPVELIRAYQKHRPLGHFGHDIYLTCAGHGTGFWDRGLGDLGKTLTEICKQSRIEVMGYLVEGSDDTVEVEVH